jgi:hypothetical protein
MQLNIVSKHILPLGEEKTRVLLLNLHSKEVMKRPEILHGEFLLKSCNGAAQKTNGRSCQDNIIHVQ